MSRLNHDSSARPTSGEPAAPVAPRQSTEPQDSLEPPDLHDSTDLEIRGPAGRILWLLPLLLILAGAAVGATLFLYKPEAEREAVAIALPEVQVLEVRFESVRIDVDSQGVAAPRTEAAVVSEVRGTVHRVADTFESGRFVREGEALVWVDDRDYRLALAAAEASLAQARSSLAREEAEAEAARREWEQLDLGTPSPLVLHLPQLAERRAAVAAAEASVRQTELDLERTVIHVPFDGRIRSKHVDQGGYVGPGTPLLTLYSVDAVEIRLPVVDSDLAFLDLVPDGRRGRAGPAVELSASFAGAVHHWRGRIDRTEGELDPRTRMVHLIARVEDPYGLRERRQVPLAVGLFLDARIEGRVFPQLVRLPRTALLPAAQVLIVDDDNRLQLRDVEVLRSSGQETLLSGGLVEGDRVVVSAVERTIPGMTVRVRESSVEPVRHDPPTGPAVSLGSN